ncbi:glycosyltransferase family 1 protein [Heyndrickxia coagulans]|uniref:glycosyltransferase family 4 protein n=1 Tax=Heyndrickxia coagulans TaxID=1398 RepID=UPI003D1B3553
MIKIILNATLLEKDSTGIGKYQYNVLKKISKKKNLCLKVILNSDFVNSNQGTEFINNIKTNNPNIEVIVTSGNKSIYRLKSLLGFFLKKDYIYHDLSFNSAIGKIGKAKIVTFHDAFFLDKNLNRKKFGAANFNAKYILPWSAKNADHLVVHTNVVRNLLINGLNIPSNKISVIPMGNPAELDDIIEEKSLTNNQMIINGTAIKKPYFLAVGAGQARKRTKDLILASIKTSEQHELVITGRNAINEPDVKKLLSKNSKVKILNYVSQGELISLYKNASGLFFPSTEEGFGFPIIEGLKYNIPVFASAIPVFKEVGANFINYFNVGDINKISYYMSNVLSGNVKQNNREEVDEWLKKYSWDNYVEELICLYKRYNT